MGLHGNWGLTDAVEGVPLDAGKLVLSPTRSYAPLMAKILPEWGSHIKGMVHCSGGAQTKVLHFVENVHVIKDNLFPTPPLFQMIQKSSGTDWKEMYEVFNMGHRMEIYTDSGNGKSIIENCLLQWVLMHRLLGVVSRFQENVLLFQVRTEPINTEISSAHETRGCPDKKLSSISDRYHEVEKLVGDPDVIKDAKRYRDLMREYKRLESIVQHHSLGRFP